MNKLLVMTAVAALLAGCADTVEVPVDRVNQVVDVVVTPGVDDEDDVVVPVTISGGVVTVGAVEEARYDGTALLVQIALDGPEEIQAYNLLTALGSGPIKCLDAGLSS
jgi:hypothetical protein